MYIQCKYNLYITYVIYNYTVNINTYFTLQIIYVYTTVYTDNT